MYQTVSEGLKTAGVCPVLRYAKPDTISSGYNKLCRPGLFLDQTADEPLAILVGMKYFLPVISAGNDVKEAALDLCS
jgi:hypothetical protein